MHSTCVCICMHLCMCGACMYVCMCVYVCIYVHECMCVYISMHACNAYLHMYMSYIYAYTYVHACTYIYTNIHNACKHACIVCRCVGMNYVHNHIIDDVSGTIINCQLSNSFGNLCTLREHLPSDGTNPSSLNVTGFELVTNTFTIRTTRQPRDNVEFLAFLSTT